MLDTNNQSSILQRNIALQKTLKDRRAFREFADKKEFVTCDAPKGHLVVETPAQQFKSMFTDTFKDVKNLGTALNKGKSNDHSLGRMNDLGMKLGGGLIAAALMGSRATSNKKLMEFVGFGTFFSVMSLWPKLAIDLPTKLRYGFNPHQKYEDSQGRKKQFFLDNQYLPWDVWSKKDLEKVANKMNIPEDIQDREEYTKEKMRTIALQDNTLWMGTAGFATPLLTSLACNRIEEGLKIPVARAELKGVEKSIKNADDIIAKIVGNKKLYQTQDEQMKQAIDSLKNGILPDNLENTLDTTFDVRNMLRSGNDSVIRTHLADKGIGKTLYNSLFGNLKKTIVFEQNSELAKLLTEGETPEKAADILKKLNEVAGRASAEATGEMPTLIDIAAKLEQDGISESWVGKIYDLSDEVCDKAIKSASRVDKDSLRTSATKLDDIYQNWLKPSQARMKFLEDTVFKLNGVAGEKYNRAGRAFVKLLGFSDKEITYIKNHGNANGDVQNLMIEKLSSIAGDNEKYNKVMRELDKQIAKAENGTKGIVKGKINTLLNAVISKASNGKVPEHIGELGKQLNGTISEAEADLVGSSIQSVNSTLIKMKNCLELEKAIQNNSIFELYAKEAGTTVDKLDKESLANLFRKLSWQSTYGDTMNKAYMSGNGGFFNNIAKTVFSSLDKSTEGADLKRMTHELLVRETYIPNPALSKEGDAIIGKFSGMCWNAMGKYNETAANKITNFGQLPLETIKELQASAIKEMGGDETKVAEIFKSSGAKFANHGESLVAVLEKQAKQIYNDRKWMKVFGVAAIALVGITLISQLFFGKVKNAELYTKKQDNNKDSFEGGK